MFEEKALEGISGNFKREYEMYKFDPSSWIQTQVISSFSQVGVQIEQPPSQEILLMNGRLIWACSLFEQVVSRCVFWLSCLKNNKIIDLPGQGMKLSSEMGQLNKLIQENEISRTLGVEAVTWTRAILKSVSGSLKFRDDLVHGYHLGCGYPGNILRVPGKRFVPEQSHFVEISPLNCTKHTEIFLEAVAVLSLYDDYFTQIEEYGDC